MKENQPSYQDIINLVSDLKKDVKRLSDENTALKNRIRELEHPKNSNNSSIPPSKDENRPKRNQSLREKTGRKTGGQPGHKGYSLQFSDAPDTVINHSSEKCLGCGADISEIIPFSIRKKQVVDIPPVKPVYTEHRCHSKQCGCGHITAGVFPKNLKAPIQYGQNIEHLVAYLSVGQYLPYQRITSLLKNMLGLSLSEGTLKNMLERFAKRLDPTYQKIRKDMELALTVGADETGAKTDGKKWWFWTWQNLDATYIAASGNRAFSTVEEHFPNGFKYATLISDRYSAHLKTRAHAHQLCMSHILRDINYLIELADSASIKRFRGLIKQALSLKQTLDHDEKYRSCYERNIIMKSSSEILDRDHSAEHEKVQVFFKEIGKHRKHLFEFLFNSNVPPDNNASERAIRNVKVKQKISTQYKTEWGIKSYAVIRSVYDTCIKRGVDFFDLAL